MEKGQKIWTLVLPLSGFGTSLGWARRFLVQILKLIEVSATVLQGLFPLRVSDHVMNSQDPNIEQAFNVCRRNEIMITQHAKRAQCGAFSLQWITMSYLL